MKKKIPFLLSFIILFSIVLKSCSTDDTINNSNNEQKIDFKIYKNQTENPDANTLQAQVKTNDATLSFYGTFDADRNPTEIETISYQKTNNDTLINFVVDKNTSKISSIFYEVNNVKLSSVLKFNYPESGNYVNLTSVNYDWNNDTFETVSSINVLVDNNLLRVLNKKSGSVSEFIIAAAAIHTAIQVTSGVVSTALAVYAAAPILTASVAVVGTLLILDMALNKANASELKLEDIPYPEKTKIENPKPETFKPEVITNDCTGVLINFEAKMDSQGNILIFGGEGGTSPYSYMLGGTSEFKPFPVYNDKPNGSYVVSAKDANGCITTKMIKLERPCDLEIEVSKNANSATVAVINGNPPYTYSWSNGATTQTVTNLANGTYTVTVKDSTNCQVSETITIGETNDYLVGNWTLTKYKHYDEPWKNVNEWYNHNHPDCNVISVKDKYSGNAEITENSYIFTIYEDAIIYNIDENCVTSDNFQTFATKEYWGTYIPQIITQNNSQIFNTIINNAKEIHAGEIMDEWTNPGLFFEIENENTMIVKIPENGEWIYYKFERQ